MGSERMLNKFRGCVIGAAVGDAVGAPLEFWTRDLIAKHPQGTEWIEEMLPFGDRSLKAKSALWVWQDDAPLGTATDDTRESLVFVDAAIKYGQYVTGRLVAAELLDRYLNCDQYYPGYHDLARSHFGRNRLTHACEVLGMPCPNLPDVPVYALSGLAARRGPSLTGLLGLPVAGLLKPGDPEGAYKRVWELDYMDVGYAVDATALLGAMVAAGFDESLTPREAIRKGLAVNPFRIGELPQGFIGRQETRTMVEWIARLLDYADQAKSDREFVDMHSHAVQALSPFDPIDVLGIGVAACYRSEADPRRSIIMAVNDRDFDEKGEFARFRDTDCTSSVCGALAGALTSNGIEDFPPDWVANTVAANRQVYGFDLEEKARKLYEVITVGK